MNWKCSQCEYFFEGETPPETCPSCLKKCQFIDISCYIPECGGDGGGKVDYRLAGKDK